MGSPSPVHSLTMLAALLAASIAAAPVLSLSESELDTRIAEAHKLPFSARIDALSRLFVGVPYTDLPLGDGDSGPEPGPLFRTDGVDCQTYVETVLAMANATGLDQAKAGLTDIRYADGKPSFQTRNHFTEAQWLPAHARKGYLTEAGSPAEPFDASLQRQTEYKTWRVVGVALAGPLEARSRVSRIKTASR